MNKNLNLIKVEEYCRNHTSETPVLLKNLELETKAKTALPQMLCGKLEGRFLKMLVSISQAKTILEIGMFTGYSALSMAEALPVDGKLITLEIDEEVEKLAKKYYQKSPHGYKIHVKLGPAKDTLTELTDHIHRGDLSKFDLVFIDADKKAYPDYFQAVLPLVRTGGLIVADNTLSDGRVLNPITTNRGRAMDDFNQMIVEHSEVEVVLLPIRDGVSLIRKK